MRTVLSLAVVLVLLAVAPAEVVPRTFFFHHSDTPVPIPGGTTSFFLDGTAPTAATPLVEHRRVDQAGSNSFPTFAAGAFPAATRLAPIASTTVNLSAGQHGLHCLDIAVDVEQLHAGGGMTSLGSGNLNGITLPQAGAGGTAGYAPFRVEFPVAGSPDIPAGDSVAVGVSITDSCRTGRDVFLAYDASAAESRLAFNCCFARAAKCVGAKINAAGKKAACRLDLEATEAFKGSPPDPAKMAQCGAKMSAVFVKNDAKGGCNTTGDASTIEAKVDALVDDVDNELSGPSDPPPQSKCNAVKLKAAGKRAQCTLAVHAKAAAKGSSPDPAKLLACADKMSAAFTKAETAGDCMANGDAAAIGSKIDMFGDDVVAELACRCGSPSGAFLDAATEALD